MQKQKVLITGIAGSGGSYLSEYLVNNHPNIEVHGIARWHSTTTLNNLKDIRDRIIIHESDLLDLSSIINVLRKVKPYRIFSLAAHANVRVCFDTPTAIINNNIMSTANLLEAIRLECPETVLQICSTSEVYGQPQYNPIDEKHPLLPVNPYAVSKLTQESLAYAYFKSWKLNIIITRMFAYINPRRRDLFASAFASQIVNIERGKQKILKHGNLHSARTIIDVRDAMETYWIACDFCKFGEPYNIGGRATLTVGDVLDILKFKAKVKIKTQYNKDLFRPVDIVHQVPDASKFYEATGWTPKYNLNDSIEFLLNYYRKEIK